MGVGEEVSALPGGGAELAGILRSVNGSPDTIRAVATRWRGAASALSDNTRVLRTAVTNIDSAWEGASADAFVTHMRAYGLAGDGLRDALRAAATALDAAALALESAETNVRGICGDLLDKVRAFRSRNPAATREEFDEAIAPLVGQAVTDARSRLTDAGKAVTDAEKDIRTQLDGRQQTFEAITAPGDTAYDWRPTVVPDWSKTTLASTNGGVNGGTNGAVTTASGPGPGGSGVATSGPGGGGAPGVPYVPGGGTGADIVAAARQHLGKPYIWGANGPSAFDCSGLVYYSLNQAGIKIGDTTAAGYQNSGRPVTDPRPGDLVFFGRPAAHVGIYVGDGMMIHAPRPGSEVKVAQVAGQAPIMYRRFT
jgi:WXG100 family type VII secretion target